MKEALNRVAHASAKWVRIVARTAGIALLAVTLMTLQADAAGKTTKKSVKSKPVVKKYKPTSFKAGKLTKRKPAGKRAARRSHSVQAQAKKKAVNVRKALPARSDRLQVPWTMASGARVRIAPAADATEANLARAENLAPRDVESTCQYDGKRCETRDESTASSEMAPPRVAKTACRRDGRIFLMAECGPDNASAPLAANSNAEDRQRPD